MAATWALSDETKKKIAELQSDLDGELETLRGKFDGKSERWQNGDLGLDVGAWLDELDYVAEQLQDMREEAG